ncbi:MAG: hypothetical protein KAR19_06620 [Bacteroidales bacterium]|nr:hypothetical protein [Bacteroidales bacterium]
MDLFVLDTPPESLDKNIVNPPSFSIHAQLRFYLIEQRSKDRTGKRVETIYNSYVPAGELSVAWDLNDSDGEPVPAGIYLISIHSGSAIKTDKVEVVR